MSGPYLVFKYLCHDLVDASDPMVPTIFAVVYDPRYVPGDDGAETVFRAIEYGHLIDAMPEYTNHVEYRTLVEQGVLLSVHDSITAACHAAKKAYVAFEKEESVDE